MSKARKRSSPSYCVSRSANRMWVESAKRSSNYWDDILMVYRKAQTKDLFRRKK